MQAAHSLTPARLAVVDVHGRRRLRLEPLRTFEGCPRLRIETRPGGRRRDAETLGWHDIACCAGISGSKVAGTFTHRMIHVERGGAR